MKLEKEMQAEQIEIGNQGNEINNYNIPFAKNEILPLKTTYDGKKITDIINWTLTLFFVLVGIMWVVYVLNSSTALSIDSPPAIFMAFLLIIIILIKLSVKLMQQHKQDRQNSNRMTLHLKKDDILFPSVTKDDENAEI